LHILRTTQYEDAFSIKTHTAVMAREMAKTEANRNEDIIKDRLWRTRGVRQA